MNVSGSSVLGHLRRTARRHPQLADATIAVTVFAATVLTTFAGHPASTTARRSVAVGTAAARTALSHVKSASRKALEELRDTVSLLRQPGEPLAPTEMPAPGLDALGELLAELRASGLAVDCLVTGSAVPLAPAADRTAYRVIQESMTNVRKHTAGRLARLTPGYDRGELRITVDDPGGGETGEVREEPRSVRDWLPTGQHGITGMRERVLALGGRFAASPRPGAGSPRSPNGSARSPCSSRRPFR